MKTFIFYFSVLYIIGLNTYMHIMYGNNNLWLCNMDKQISLETFVVPVDFLHFRIIIIILCENM